MSTRIIQGDVIERLRELPDESIHCVVTSPPYWGLRDYGVAGQLGLEATPAEFISKMVAVFREVRRVLRSDGTCWVNMGDAYNAGTSAKRKAPSTGVDVGGWNDAEIDGGARVKFAGLKPKDLIGMPWRLAFALQEDGWWLRQDIIWSKPNPMPESVTDRCTKAHEYIFLLTKRATYFYDAENIKEESAAATGPRALRAQKSDARANGVPGQPAHSLHAPRNSKNSFRGQGSNRDSEQGPANRDGRDMSTVGVGATRNKRSVWEIATEAFPEAHFATFPTKLVEPCILAGTSERGCCSKCGAPWLRMTEQVDTGRTQKMTDGWAVGDWAHGSILPDELRKGESGKPVMAVQTTGWKAGCQCEAATTPCTILDPFSGAGTTGLVAVQLGRQYIGIELNPEYAAMSERRISGATLQSRLFAPHEMVAEESNQICMFEEPQ